MASLDLAPKVGAETMTERQSADLPFSYLNINFKKLALSITIDNVITDNNKILNTNKNVGYWVFTVLTQQTAF